TIWPTLPSAILSGAQNAVTRLPQAASRTSPLRAVGSFWISRFVVLPRIVDRHGARSGSEFRHTVTVPLRGWVAATRNVVDVTATLPSPIVWPAAYAATAIGLLHRSPPSVLSLT